MIEMFGEIWFFLCVGWSGFGFFVKCLFNIFMLNGFN